MNTERKQFMYKLIPPRPTFAQDMTEAERKVMQEHVVYWKGLTDRRIAIVFGPVLDPKGPWGVAIVEVADEADARALGTNDPAVKAGLTFEVYAMPGTVVRR
jgi:uncharacterized protein YciI